MKASFRVHPQVYDIPDRDKPLQSLGTQTNLIFIAFFLFFQGLGAFTSQLWYINHWKISLVYVNLAAIILAIPVSYINVAIGYFGDNISTRFGRRKPLILLGVVLETIAIFGLSRPPSYDQKYLFAWWTFWSGIYFSSSVLVRLPLNSWLMESTLDDADFLHVNTAAVNTGFLCGSIIGLYLTITMDPKTFAIIFVIGSIVSMVLLIKFVSNPSVRDSQTHFELIPSVRICLRTQNFQTLFFSKIFSRSAIMIQMQSALLLVFVGFDKFSHYAPAMVFVVKVTIISASAVLVFNIAMNFALRYVDKFRIYKIILLLLVVLGILVFPVSDESFSINFMIFTAFGVLFISFGGVLSLIENLFTRDLVVLDSLLTHSYRETMYQTALSLPVNLIVEGISNIPRILFFGSGFVAGTNNVNDDQIVSKFIWNNTVIWEIRLCSSFLVALLMLAAYLVIRTYGIPWKTAQKISSVLNERRQVTCVQYFDTWEDFENDCMLEMVLKQDSSEKALIKEVSMIYLHFDATELKLFSEMGFEGIEKLRRKIIVGIFLAISASVLLLASLARQIGSEQFALSVLFVVCIFLLSLYVLYELLRLRAISMLRSRYSDIMRTDPVKIKEAMKLGTGYVDANFLEKLFDESNSTSFSITEIQNMSHKESQQFFGDDFVLVGYGFIFSCLVILNLIGIFGLSLLFIHSSNPSGHSPTMQPTSFLR